MASQYDLYQISQIAITMSGVDASRHVPDEYWTSCVEPAMAENLKDFHAHRDQVSVSAFIDDYSKCLISFGIRGVGSQKLMKQTCALYHENLKDVNPRSLENFLFFIDRCARTTDVRDAIAAAIHLIEDNDWAPKMRDHLLILSLI